MLGALDMESGGECVCACGDAGDSEGDRSSIEKIKVLQRVQPGPPAVVAARELITAQGAKSSHNIHAHLSRREGDVSVTDEA